MSTTHYLTAKDGVKGGFYLRISMSVFVWAMFCSYLLVIPELFDVNMSGVHLNLLDVVSIFVLLFLLTRPSLSPRVFPSAVVRYRRFLYIFVLYMVLSSLYGFVINDFPGGIIGAIKVVSRQVWPVIQVLLFFNLGLIFSRYRIYGENLFIGIISTVALADIVINIGRLDLIHFIRPLAPQSMVFIFCYLLILELLIAGRIDNRKVNTLLLFCMLVLNFIAIMMSVTRTAFGALVIGTVLMLMQKFFSKKIKFEYMFGTAIIVFILAGVFVKLGFVDAFIYRTFNIEDSERIMIWFDAWRMFTEKPLMGVGTGYYINNSMVDNFDLVGGVSAENISRDAILVASAHNTYLYTLATSGIIGFIIYLTVLGKTMSLINKQLRGVDWVKTFFYITFFLSLFEESTFLPSNRYMSLFLIPFWYFLGARLLAASRY